MLAPARHDLEECVARIDALKVFPVAAVRILRVAADPDATLRAMVVAVCADPVLAARVLTVANSPLAGLRAPVSTVERAVAVLGLMDTRDVTMTALVGSVAPAVAPWGPLLHQHAQLTAHLSRALAQEVPTVDPAEAFVTGLLHDLGHQLLLAVDPEPTVTLLDTFYGRPLLLERAERLHFGFGHAGLSAAIMERWGLPDAVRAVVAAHHQPPIVGEVSLSAVVLQVADDLADAVARGGGVEEMLVCYERHAVSSLLGIPMWRVEALLAGAEEIIAEL